MKSINQDQSSKVDKFPKELCVSLCGCSSPMPFFAVWTVQPRRRGLWVHGRSTTWLLCWLQNQTVHYNCQREPRMQRTIYLPRSETVKKKDTLPSTRKIIRVDSWPLYKRCITHHFVTSSEEPLHGPGPVFSQLLEHQRSSVRSKGSAWQINQQHLLNYLSSNYLVSLILPVQARHISCWVLHIFFQFAVKIWGDQAFLSFSQDYFKFHVFHKLFLGLNFQCRNLKRWKKACCIGGDAAVAV